MLTETAVTGCLVRSALAALQKGYEFEGRSTLSASEEILRVLEHDGYIKPGRDGYQFESYLLQDWWKKRYGYFHVPVLDAPFVGIDQDVFTIPIKPHGRQLRGTVRHNCCQIKQRFFASI
jgi:hypothetical protein